MQRGILAAHRAQLDDHAVRRVELGDLEIGRIREIEHDSGCAGRGLGNSYAADEFIADLRVAKRRFAIQGRECRMSTKRRSGSFARSERNSNGPVVSTMMRVESEWDHERTFVT